MKEQTNYDYEKYVQIAQMAKMGWWESDLKNQEYICSDFIVDLLGLKSNRISFTEFHQRIREDHRLRLKKRIPVLIQFTDLRTNVSYPGKRRRNLGVLQNQFPEA